MVGPGFGTSRNISGGTQSTAWPWISASRCRPRSLACCRALYVVARRRRIRRRTIRGLVEAEHRGESVVDGPHLLGRELTGPPAEALGIHCTDLFDEHAGCLPGHVDLRSKRCWTGAARRGGN